MSRILILHASVGAGHQRAAEALGLAFAQRQTEQVWVEDTLNYGRGLFRQVYARSYLEMSEHAPALWSYFYERSDQNESRRLRDLRALISRIGLTEFDGLIKHRDPDAIICTHFLPLNILARRRRSGQLVPPLFCVVTDYTGHVFWVYPEVDRYFVATPLAGAMLARRGVAEAAITVTGIPIDPVIALPKDAERTRQVRQLDRAPVILLMGGGLAVERVRQIALDLLRRDLTGTLVVVAGRNEALQEGLRGLPTSPTLDVRVLGFVSYVDDLVAASDLVITKAGGLIVSEVMARGTPLVVIDPIPGQEEWNADYVVSVGAGVQLRLGAMVAETVDHLLAHPAYRQVLRDGARQAGRPRAALVVADAVLAALRR
jgi:processive 1,2-diacylglycerol beta-glucosyltransferase